MPGDAKPLASGSARHVKGLQHPGRLPAKTKGEDDAKI